MPDNPDRERLATRLRELRAATGLSGNRFAAERIGWPQSRLSRLETAVQLPTEADIRAWVDATGAGVDEEGELLALLERARIEYATWRTTYRRAGGAAGKQISVAELESRAALITGYQPRMVLGLLQTPAYTREMLALPGSPVVDDDLDAMVTERIQRQQVLYQGAKQIHLVMGEAALRARVGTLETLLAQLDRLVTMTDLPGVEIGIIPDSTPVLPVPGFTIYDTTAVTSETLTGEQRLDEPDEVAEYHRFFNHVRDAAATGPDAVALIQQVASELRERGDRLQRRV